LGFAKADIIADLDLSTMRRPNQKQKRVNVDFPVWVIDSLDREACRVGVTRQSIIKLWLVERLEKQALAGCPTWPQKMPFFSLYYVLLFACRWFM